ncbi:hypothetical protein [Cellulomonas xiejunii]|uniref:Uncharacterized protein n=1 Tax=Cellulomonas xiejunii TaxID=2968083 RepID=A0ABY5KPU2_9CELL|nr:hypothetical protein [Cellulomonas xiejunii]MCC2314206.1 hypothetical protein [Cellulomonas xiejunii]MCC2319568.1 hypothetical protein [Cellulomonas xiejunii]UUI71486.1 hypothetical protein NP048_17100 [Cellulomonas xiejunii]
MNRQSSARTLQVMGVLVFAVLSWRRAVSSDVPWWPSVLAAVALVAAIAAGVWWWSRRDDGKRRRTVTARPGWHTQAVWAEETLGASLAQLGASARKVRGGTRLTFAWSASGVEVWRGDDVLLSRPWSQVWTITATTGRAASTGNPAVELVTRESVRIVLVPTRRPDGGMLPASASQVDALVGELRAAREAAGSAVTPSHDGTS